MWESLDFGTPSDIPSNADNWKMASPHWKWDHSGSTLSTSPYVCGDSCWHIGIHKWDPGRRKCEVSRSCNEKTFPRSGPHTCFFVLLFIFCINKAFSLYHTSSGRIIEFVAFQAYIRYQYPNVHTHTHTHTHIYMYTHIWVSYMSLVVKNPPANAGDITDARSILWYGRSPGGHSNPLQSSCLENPMDRGAWQAIVHWVVKSCTWLKGSSLHTCIYIYIYIYICTIYMCYVYIYTWKLCMNM